MNLRKQGRIGILRTRNFTLVYIKNVVFQVVTSWLKTVLSPFFHTADNGFRDFWTDASHLFADSFFQPSDFLGILLIGYFYLE